MADAAAVIQMSGSTAATHTRKRALIELALAYALILAVIWSPRPWQRILWILAVGSVAAMTVRSWEGGQSVGLRSKNFLRSLWVPLVALAFAVAAVMLAVHLQSLRLPYPFPTSMAQTNSPFGHTLLFVKTFWGYALWTFVQQFLLQGFFLLRMLQIIPSPKTAAFAAATLFALAHIPNPVLAIATLLWGFAACVIFLRYRNLYPLAIAHAIFGVTLAITVPPPLIRNMRVGLGYLTYGHRHASVVSFQPKGPDSVH
jgi:membrane protease YdiL (CAAX protease family)